MSRCFVCREAEAREGHLCIACVTPLAANDAVLPEHIQSPRGEAAIGCIFDRWGRAHAVGRRSMFGRKAPATHKILSASISRLHAELRSEDGVFTLVDFGSRNGSFVDGVQISGPTKVPSGGWFRVATTAFRLCDHVPDALVVGSIESIRTQDLSAHLAPTRDIHLPFRLSEPSRGGGGVLEAAGVSLTLGCLQFALFDLLTDRYTQDFEAPDAVRGFLPSVELLARLPWQSREPSDANLKQLVRWVRERTADLGVTIEGVQGLGYRLRFEEADLSAP